jgi:predicted RNase H-like HicB family nuclease
VEIAHSEQDEGYVARVPELGCSAWGGSVEDAAREVQDSIEAHLQALRKLGRPISSTLSRRSGSATTRSRSSPSPSPTPRFHCAVVLGTIRPTPRPAARGSDDLTTPCSR